MRRVKSLYILVGCAVVLILFGCSQNREKIENAKNRLELARTKNDFDQMYLVLKELSSLQKDDPATADELKKVEAALPLLEQIKINKADHNHEAVVHVSSELLKIFPQHAEARRALRESGLIFSYLQKSLNLFNECLSYDTEKQQACLIQTTSDSNSKKTDFAKIVNNLNVASNAINDALKLDPYFDKAVTLQKTLAEFRNTIGISIAYNLYFTSQMMTNANESIFDIIYDGMTKSIKYSSPSEFWKKIHPIVQKNEQDFNKTITELNEMSSFLISYKDSDISQLTTIAIEININASNLVKAVANPRGSMIDYKNDVSTLIIKNQELLSRFKSSCPNPEMVNTNVHGFGETLNKYELFRKPGETMNILQQNKELLSS